jgi:SAM-dependent methyltransferase
MSTKTVQGKLWSAAPDYWSNYFEPYFLPMYRKTLDKMILTGDTLLLDAGCGSGLFSSMAIQAGAQVVGIDAAPGLLEIARRRNPENTFLEEDLEAMPFEDEAFDLVTGFNSFQYAGNFTNALVEAKRVLKKGGRLVIGIWDKPEMSEAATVLKAIGTLMPPPPAGTPGPFALSEDGKIAGICEGIGLKMIAKMKAACPFLYARLGDSVNSFMGTGPAAAATNHTDKYAVAKTIENAMKPFCVTEEIYFLQNSFLIFIAEK